MLTKKGRGIEPNKIESIQIEANQIKSIQSIKLKLRAFTLAMNSLAFFGWLWLKCWSMSQAHADQKRRVHRRNSNRNYSNRSKSDEINSINPVNQLGSSS